MSIDRRIGLETAISQGTRTMADSGGHAAGRQASDADRQAFERAMSQGETEAAPEPPAASSPFALFGANARAQVPAGDSQSESLAQALSETAEQLLVADGSQGRRQVRVELKDDVLPGVSVSVYEEEGRTVADFTCANERSRERLCEMAPDLAAQLAESLDRPTRVRVGTDDPEDPCLAETDAPAPSR
ncbi:Flagellar hook-length control protein FliK [compost metagenome]